MAHSQSTTNQIREADLRREGMQPALRDNLMASVLKRSNLQRAWKQVKANGGAAGVDGMTIEAFPDFVQTQWSSIRQALKDGLYEPAPVRRKAIPKPNGGERLLGIPRIIDRVIQQVISQVLTPLFDPDFSESSFGFRPKRSAHGAVKQVQRYINAGYRLCVDIDLEKFFDRVQHDVLMSRLARKVEDKGVLLIIRRYLQAGAMTDGIVSARTEGTPQGGPPVPVVVERPARRSGQGTRTAGSCLLPVCGRL